MSDTKSAITQLAAARELISSVIRDLARETMQEPREESAFEKLLRLKREDEEGEFGMEPPQSSTAPATTPASVTTPTDNED